MDYFLEFMMLKKTEKRKNKWANMFLGEKKLDMEAINRNNLTEFFGDTFTYQSDKLFISNDDNDIMASIFRSSIAFHFKHFDDIYKIKRFIEHFYPDQSVGLIVSDKAKKITKGITTISIKEKEKEIYKGIFDQLGTTNIVPL